MFVFVCVVVFVFIFALHMNLIFLSFCVTNKNMESTQMCQAAGKFYATIGIPIFDLVRTKPGHNGGTMVH